MVATDDWTRSAIRDGEVVAELLVTLKEAHVKPVLVTNPTVTTLRWGFRQPRSRCPKTEPESVINSRCSPITPLSWSGGSSSSPSGYEAISRQISDSFTIGSRSKVLVSAGLDFDVKRLHRKKDIALPRSPLHEQGRENKKNFKRMKMDLKNHMENEDSKENSNFLIPDLNIMPCEENGDHYVETTLYGIMIKR